MEKFTIHLTFFRGKNFLSEQIIERYLQDNLPESIDQKELRLLLLLAISRCQLLLLKEIRKKGKRIKIWVKEWLRKRNTLRACSRIRNFSYKTAAAIVNT